MKSKFLTTLGTAAPMLACSLSASHGQTTWTGATSQDWTDVSNWTAGVPGVNSKATVNTELGNFPVIATAVDKSATAGGNDFWIGNGAATSGRLDITDGGSFNANGTWMLVGNGGGSGILNVGAGGSLASNADIRFGAGAINIDGGTVNVPRIVGATGALKVSGAGSLTTTGDGTSNGSPDLNNLSVSSFSGMISAARNANFQNGTTSSMSGGSIATGGEIRIGNGGSHAFTQSGGSIGTGSWFVVGIGGAAGSGTFNFTGGTLTTSTVRTDAFSTIGAGGAVGTVNQSGGIFRDINKTLLGENTGGTGNYNLNGGTLETGRVEVGAGAGNFNFDGGTLKALRNDSEFIDVVTKVGVLTGGAKLDSNGFHVVSPASFAGVGSLEKLGSGSLTLGGSANALAGVLVSAGTLFVTGQLTTTDGTSVASVGRLGGSGTITGDLHLDSGASIDLSLGSLMMTPGSIVSFGGFTLDDVEGFDKDTALNGIYPVLAGDFTLDSTNIANFTSANAYIRPDGKEVFFTEGSLSIHVIPEPSAVLLGLAGLLVVGLRRRRA